MKENYFKIFFGFGLFTYYVDTIVKNQERYYKYSIGLELREVEKKILLGVGRANRVRGEKRVGKLELLVEQCEDFKTFWALFKELKTLKSFKQFEYASKLALEGYRQALAWQKSSARTSNDGVPFYCAIGLPMCMVVYTGGISTR